MKSFFFECGGFSAGYNEMQIEIVDEKKKSILLICVKFFLTSYLFFLYIKINITKKK